MNVTKAITMDYAKWTLGFAGQNEPKTNPILPKTNPIKAKTNPIRTQTNPIKANFSAPQTAKFTQFNINELRTMNNELIKKQTQFKPNLSCVASGEAGSDPILLKWVITNKTALDIMASATKNAYLMDLSKNRKKEENAAFYSLN